MSIQSEVTRIQNLRNRLRTKLIALGLVSSSSADLEDCVEAIENFVPILQDDTTSKKYKLGMDNGVFYTEEVSTGTAMKLSGYGINNGVFYTGG